MSIPTCKAPDPDTRKPHYVPPAGACDAHCHIFGPGSVYPYAPGRSYTPPDAPLERFRELQATLGLERAVLVNASCHGVDNTVILDAIAQSGGRYRGVANVDGTLDDKALQRLDEGGVRGVRFNFVRHLGGTPDMKVFDRVVNRIKVLDWHVVLHFDAVDLLEYKSLLDDLPVPFAQALLSVCADRILWGTDWPHPNIRKHMPNDGDLVDLIPLFMLDPALRRRVLVDNPHRLYRFSG